jgi:hypothetical protein
MDKNNLKKRGRKVDEVVEANGEPTKKVKTSLFDEQKVVSRSTVGVK